MVTRSSDGLPVYNGSLRTIYVTQPLFDFPSDTYDYTY